MEKNQKIIVVVGPTASGKSALAVRLARKFNGEIISADSRQVYRGLNIGTGKITKKEMLGIPHHMLDVANPKKRYTVAEFQEEARKNLEKIFSREHIPIICGGTGFYIENLLSKNELPNVPPNEKLRVKLNKKTSEQLLKKLTELDPRRANEIDPNNKRRIIRAIEIALTIGKVPIIKKENKENYNVLWIGITPQPDELRKKINIRLLARLPAVALALPKPLAKRRSAKAGISRGMIAEAKKMHRQGLSWKRMEELGLEYRFLARYLKKFPRMSASSPQASAMATELGVAIWHYARRQMTWFRKNKEIKWFDPKETKKIEKITKEFLKKS